MKEQKEHVRDAIDDAIDRSTVLHELEVAYIAINAVDIIFNDADRRLRDIYRANGLAAQHGFGYEDLAGLKNYSDAVRKAVYWFEKSIQPRIEDCSFVAFGAKAYDQFRADSNCIAQFLLYLSDRTYKKRGAGEVLEFLKAQPSAGLFDEEDFRRFEPRYPESGEEAKR